MMGRVWFSRHLPSTANSWIEDLDGEVPHDLKYSPSEILNSEMFISLFQWIFAVTESVTFTFEMIFSLQLV